MSVALGTNIINELYVGNTPIKKIYYAVTSSDIRTIYENQINAVKIEPLYNGSSIKVASLASGATLEYSFNGTTWFNATVGTTILLMTQQGLRNAYIRGNARSNSTSDYTNLIVSGNVKVSGNINALWDYQNLNQNLYAYCGTNLFKDSTGLYDASELTLPATTLANNCYYGMFKACTSLINAPTELPATILAEGCYKDMFEGCTSLTTAPALPATTLADNCYQYMFGSCMSLNYVKCLATDISANHCTQNWLYNVSSTGTFVKDSNMASWTRGIHGIPTDWTVINN